MTRKMNKKGSIMVTLPELIEFIGRLTIATLSMMFLVSWANERNCGWSLLFTIMGGILLLWVFCGTGGLLQ